MTSSTPPGIAAEHSGITQPDLTHPGVARPVLLVLALLSAVAPFATDLYLPAFPEMTGDLGTGATAIQLTLTSFLIGITAGQLAFGPLSDRFGRRGPLLAGALLCVASGVLAALAPTVGVLVAARFLQGFGGAAGMVIGRAIISDLATGRAAARAFSLMMIVGGVAPVLAPLLGGFLVDPIGWRGILGVVLAISVVMLVSIACVITETLPRDRRLVRRRADHPGSTRELRRLGFLGYSGTFAFSFAVMMAYISASPFVYQDMMGLSSGVYGLAFGVNAAGLMAVSALAARLVATRAVRGLVAVGISVMSTATIGFALLVVTGAPPAWLAVPLFVMVSSLGLVFGNATALAMSSVGTNAGAASAVLGALQFGLGALVSPLVSVAGPDTAGPLAIVMLVCAAIAVCAFLAAGAAAEPPHMVEQTV
ncbi:putative drug resistance transporter [Gordonia polyisoprenivorans NBRC 16320 = JCM 10675]|uniref:Multidrug effflux MFS transporter n=1 Tax=Gordonia polyisoprenivorans TaxID=84595 RepID=A0A846WQ96_9ACTN|nr:multidrug effflux MFS transporter [Gordonia polyisoprenivorans]NKY03808.1 multidrug effflux MFS transporter [Gordonia polyisoprenivorans]GAB21141.1 putative drug resistance transporter [Gordonia polyisoprenivorans NBRC 16320 = JCM 10675]